MPDSSDRNAIDEVLATTRAVRKRLDLARPVDRSLVLECLDLALQAPAGGNVQRWRWLVIEDAETKRGLAELYRRAYAPYIAAQRDAVESTRRPDASAIMASSDHLAQVLQDVPVLVVPCVVGRPEEIATQAELAGYYGSILPAVWSFMLAARSRGLGTAWTTLHLVHEREAAELLGIPDHVTQVALIPVAHTIGTEFKRASRLPLEKVTYLDRWKTPLVDG